MKYTFIIKKSVTTERKKKMDFYTYAYIDGQVHTTYLYHYAALLGVTLAWLTFCFTGRTDEEYSLVCRTQEVPFNTVAREDGWKAFRIEGTLDFSLIGILAQIADLLAKENISIFAVSTFNTDYILVKKEREEKALRKLAEQGYQIKSYRS